MPLNKTAIAVEDGLEVKGGGGRTLLKLEAGEKVECQIHDLKVVTKNAKQIDGTKKDTQFVAIGVSAKGEPEAAWNDLSDGMKANFGKGLLETFGQENPAIDGGYELKPEWVNAVVLIGKEIVEGKNYFVLGMKVLEQPNKR